MILMTGGNIAIETADLLWLISGLLGIIAILIGKLLQIQMNLNKKNEKEHQLLLASISSLRVRSEKIEENANDIQSHELQIHDAESNLNSQKQRIVKNEVYIEENNKKVDEHNKQIQKIEADINNHGQWMIKLDGKIKNNEKDINSLKNK